VLLKAEVVDATDPLESFPNAKFGAKVTLVAIRKSRRDNRLTLDMFVSLDLQYLAI
jgi:hypothetical protein